jgi:hypothetical protein
MNPFNLSGPKTLPKSKDHLIPNSSLCHRGFLSSDCGSCLSCAGPHHSDKVDNWISERLGTQSVLPFNVRTYNNIIPLPYPRFCVPLVIYFPFSIFIWDKPYTTMLGISLEIVICLSKKLEGKIYIVFPFALSLSLLMLFTLFS